MRGFEPRVRRFDSCPRNFRRNEFRTLKIEKRLRDGRCWSRCRALNPEALVRFQLPQVGACDGVVDEFGFAFRQEGLMVQEEDAGPANRRFGCNSRWVQSVFDLHNRLWTIRVRQTFVPFKWSPTACCAGRVTGCVGRDVWPSGGTEDTRRSERRAFGHGSSNLPLVIFWFVS